MFDGTKYEGSLWRDYNDHIFETIDVVQGDEHKPEVLIIGIMKYCPDWCQMSHHADGQPYTQIVEIEDLESGEIFGWTRMV